MTGNVVVMGGWTTQDIPPDRVINAAQEYEINPVVVVGKDKDGELYFASSTSDLSEVLMLLERAKQRLMSFR